MTGTHPSIVSRSLLLIIRSAHLTFLLSNLHIFEKQDAAGAGSPQELHTAVGQKWIAADAMKLLFHHGADMKVVDPKNRTLFNYGSTGCSIVAKTVSSDGGEEDDPSVYMPPNQMPLGRMLRVVMDDVVEEVQKCKSWKEETTMKTMTRARRLMEDFYNSEFAVARAKKNFLVKIFNLRRHEHLAMYNTVLAGIRKVGTRIMFFSITFLY